MVIPHCAFEIRIRVGILAYLEHLNDVFFREGLLFTRSVIPSMK